MNKNKIIIKMILFIVTFMYSSYIFAEDNKIHLKKILVGE